MNHRMDPFAMAAQPGGWGPPPPRAKSSGVAKGCAIAAGVILVLIVGACLAARAFGPSLLRRTVATAERDLAQIATPIHVQAAALGRTPPDLTTACGQNSPRLQQAMPCETYVAWIHQNAPFVPGGTASTNNVRVDNTSGVLVTQIHAQFVGPNGAGSLQYALTRVGTQWTIDSVRLSVETSTP